MSGRDKFRVSLITVVDKLQADLKKREKKYCEVVDLFRPLTNNIVKQEAKELLTETSKLCEKYRGDLDEESFRSEILHFSEYLKCSLLLTFHQSNYTI